jgi:hypothetical protein
MGVPQEGMVIHKAHENPRAPGRPARESGLTPATPMALNSPAFVVEKGPNKGRLEEPHAAERECDPVPSVEARAQDDDDDRDDVAAGDRPIDLVDIARALGESANLERLGQRAPIRAWRDHLTLIRDSLSYAIDVLTADVAVLSRPSSEQTAEVLNAVPEPQGERASGPGEGPWPPLDLEDFDVVIDEGLFARTDQLLTAHREMALVDLSSASATADVLALVQEHLAILTERHAAVDARLQQIRAVIIRHYRQAATPIRDVPA